MFLYRAAKGVRGGVNVAAAETHTHQTHGEVQDVRTEMGFDNTPRCITLDELLETVTEAMLAMPKLEEIEIYLDRRGPESGAKPFIRFNKEMIAQRKFSFFGEGFERAPDQKGLTVGSRFTTHGLAPLIDFGCHYTERPVLRTSLAGSGRAQAVVLKWATFLWQSVGEAWMEERKGRKNSEDKENSDIGTWVVEEPRIPCWLITFLTADLNPELLKDPWSDEWEFRQEIVLCGMDREKSVCGPLSWDKDLWKGGKKACHDDGSKDDEQLLHDLETKYVPKLKGRLLEHKQKKVEKRSREMDDGLDEGQARGSKKRLL